MALQALRNETCWPIKAYFCNLNPFFIIFVVLTFYSLLQCLILDHLSTLCKSGYLCKCVSEIPAAENTFFHVD